MVEATGGDHLHSGRGRRSDVLPTFRVLLPSSVVLPRDAALLAMSARLQRDVVRQAGEPVFAAVSTGHLAVRADLRVGDDHLADRAADDAESYVAVCTAQTAKESLHGM